MLYLFIASLVWAFSFGLINVNLSALDPNFVAFCRFLFAIPFFLPFLSIKNISLKSAAQLIGIGVIQYGMMYVCYIKAYQYLSAHQVALFSMLTPIYVVIFHNIFVRKFTWFPMLMALLSILGGGIIYYKAAHQANLMTGFLLMQIANLCFAYGQVAYIRFRQHHVNYKDRAIYPLLFIGALCVTALTTTMSHGWQAVYQVSSSAWLTLIYLGSVSTGLCFYWWNKGALTTPPATLAVLNNMKGPLAIVVSLLFFHETANLLRLSMGLGLIMLATVLAQQKRD